MFKFYIVIDQEKTTSAESGMIIWITFELCFDLWWRAIREIFPNNLYIVNHILTQNYFLVFQNTPPQDTVLQGLKVLGSGMGTMMELSPTYIVNPFTVSVSPCSVNLPQMDNKDVTWCSMQHAAWCNINKLVHYWFANNMSGKSRDRKFKIALCKNWNKYRLEINVV